MVLRGFWVMSYSLASSTWDNKELEVVRSLLELGRLTMGEEVADFERRFALYIGTKYAVMFNSGSSANLAMLAALKYVRGSRFCEGDEVIVPAVSWSTTFYPINQLGFVLTFVDIDPHTLNIDVHSIEERITPKTRAIFAVNLLGNPADLVALRELSKKHDLVLLEDNCESLGASVHNQMTGSFGHMSSHSFYYSHHICTIEGGMVNTDSKELMETLVSLRSHGWIRGLDADNSVYPRSLNNWDNLFKFVLPGYNIRPIELSGAIGKVQLEKLPKFLENRRKNAALFTQLFKNSSNYTIQQEHGASSWFGFSIVLRDKLQGKRDQLISYLDYNKIETRPIVAGNFTLNPVMSHLRFSQLGKLDSANLIHNEGFFVGNHHFEIYSDIEKLHTILQQFEAGY
jgi:CDP-6-deoxy-D-xylo-4-hexulose-3-dehydrase